MMIRKDSNVYIVIMLSSVILAIGSYLEMAYFHHMPMLALGSAFLINNIVGVAPDVESGSFPMGGWTFFIAYVLFHCFIITANGISAISAFYLYVDATSRIKRLFFPMFLVLLSCYLISYYLLFALIGWWGCLSFILCNWPKADKIIQTTTFYIILTINLLYLVLLLVMPVVPTNMMP